jgi:hypothetical protein
MLWKVGTCTSDKCSQSKADTGRTISLVEQKGNKPWKPEGDPHQGWIKDYFSPEPRTWNQRWFVDDKQVQIVIGKDRNGKLIKTWELHWEVRKMDDRPILRP